MKKVKIVVLASMVALLALFGASAQTITDHSIPVPAGEVTTAVAPTPAASTAPTAQTDQTGNHEFEGEETDGNGQTDDEATASEENEAENEAENETEKPDTEESATLEQGGAKTTLDAQSANSENTVTPDTDNVEVEE